MLLEGLGSSSVNTSREHRKTKAGLAGLADDMSGV